jgi:hypothetical protein
MTHEHADHISGFRSAQEKFGGFEVDQIWMAWTENPEDPQALEFDKYKGTAVDALAAVSDRMGELQDKTGHLSAIRSGVDQVLGFFGAKGDQIRATRTALVDLLKGKSKPIYREPKQDPFEIAVEGLRIYVLGPPRDTKMFGITERASELYGMGAREGSPLVRALSDPIKVSNDEKKPWDDFTSPFDYNEGFCLSDLMNECQKAPKGGPFNGLTPQQREALCEGAQKEKRARCLAAQFLYDYYDNDEAPPPPLDPELDPQIKHDPDQHIRRIDGDWLGVAADLAIQLDSRTNNSSLVLAFEFTDTGRVMLFVGDAQVGNWLSWKDVSWKMGDKTVKAHDLLARTVFYKVGHHGSHNATLKQNGLELMVHPDLAAFIPTNEEDAKKVKWGEMPYKTLLQALEKSANSRVVRADDEWVKEAQGEPDFRPSGSIKAIRHKEGLYVEFDVA